MDITDELFERVLENARLKLSEEEKKRFKADIYEVLAAFAVIDEAPVNDEKPSYHPIPLENKWDTEDQPETFSEREKLWSQLKRNYEGYVWGPKIKKGQK